MMRTRGGCLRLSMMAAVFWMRLFVGDERSVAADSTSPEATFQFVVSGMRNERSRFVSGACRFNGNFKLTWPKEPARNLDGPMEGFLAFDGNRVRFDYTRPGWVVDPTTVRVIKSDDSSRPTADTVRGMLTTRFAEDKTRVTLWHSDNPLLAIAQPQDFADRRTTGWFDIRGINLYEPISIERGDSLEKVFTDLVGFAKCDGHVTRDGDSTWVLRWAWAASKKEITNWTLVVDVRSGFTPVSYRCETVQHEHPDNKILEYEYKTEWQVVQGVSVPVRHQSFRAGFSPAVEEVIWNYRWEAVNESVADDLFQYTTFDVPDSVAIQDVSGKQVVMIRDFPYAARRGSAASRWRMALEVFGAVAGAAILVAFHIRSRGRAKRRAMSCEAP